MSARGVLFGAVAGLAAAVMTTGVLVIQAEHQARQLFVELESLNRERDRLQADWGRLQLEESTWATHGLIEAVARDRLNMRQVDAEEIVLVAEPPVPAVAPGAQPEPGARAEPAAQPEPGIRAEPVAQPESGVRAEPVLAAEPVPAAAPAARTESAARIQPDT